MNKSKLLIALSLILIVLNIVSCDNEPIDPALINTEDPNACAAPTTFEASDFIGGTSVNLSWSAAAGTGSWQIQYGTAGFAVGSGTQLLATDTQATVTGLTSTTNYEFYIRTVCDATSFSSWVGPISVGEEIGSCAQPTNVTAVRSSGNTEITVSWDAATATSWQVQYGTTGFALGSGTTVSSTTPTKTITGVLANTGYSFYVRANCSSSSNSNWTGPINVAAVGTGPGPIDTTPALMTANIDGVQWNNLKPFFYPFTNDVNVENDGAEPGEPRFIWIQGTDNTTSINLNNSREINLHIPDSKWAPGTYNLLWDNGYEDDECWATLLLFTNPDVNARIISGSLTVTEFNLSTRRIKGTFEFEYEKLDESGDVIGVFPVINGTFNYGLDDDYFD